MHAETPKQRSRLVTLGNGQSVTVRRMFWKPHKELIRAIPAEIKRLDLFGLEKLKLMQLVEKLPEIITSCETLLDMLLLPATNLTKEQIDTELDALDVGELVRVALELHIDDELKNCWAGVAGVIAAFLPSRVVAGAGADPAMATPGEESTET